MTLFYLCVVQIGFFFMLTPVVIKIGCHANKLMPLETAKLHTDATTKSPIERAKICTTIFVAVNALCLDRLRCDHTEKRSSNVNLLQ